MNGHSLTIPAVAGAGTVQNSAAGDTKELIIALASDSTNGDTAFAGNLKLVKTGVGVLTSSIAQSYSGGRFRLRNRRRHTMRRSRRSAQER